MEKKLKWLAAILAVIIFVLLGVLLFYSPAKGPSVPPAALSGYGTGGVAAARWISPDGALAVTSSSISESGFAASPVTIAGAVTGGGWFFEGTFPAKVLDGDGTVLGASPIRAEGDWMSTGTVPFSASLSFSSPKFAVGEIVLQNDNPSGDPKRSKTLIIPVRFK